VTKQFISKLKRTHTCGELTLTDHGKRVVLMGWSMRRRNHGGLIFIDLRDRTGITQIVFNPIYTNNFHKNAHRIRPEFCLAIQGLVHKRPENQNNKQLITGQIEVFVEHFEILNSSIPLPFMLESWSEVKEHIRFRYRYLDFRRAEIFAKLLLRHRCTQAIRDFLNKQNFLEIETPILARSTPEGARDFLVPSRLTRDSFYALPQSPQLFKQLLMIGGIERYYQIARCFRDEDLRSDRQPEFTQIDIEMSFINEEDIIKVSEGLIETIITTTNQKITLPIQRLTYNDAINRFGLDTPDLRFGLELIDITDLVDEVEFKLFRQALINGFIVKAINGKNMTNVSRKDLEELTLFVKNYGAKGLAWAKIKEKKKWHSPIAKFFNSTHQKLINKRLNATEGDILFFITDTHKIVSESLGRLRLNLAQRFKLHLNKPLTFCWITNFPLLNYDLEKDRHVAVHHPFTAPNPNDLPFLNSNPTKIRARAYDITLNGNEIGGGSIRIHNSKIQKKIFKILKLSPKEINEKFGFLLEALNFGAPPHGGIALGFDRLLAILTDEESIREIIPFPKTQKGFCLLTEAPGLVTTNQLLELGIKIEKNY